MNPGETIITSFIDIFFFESLFKREKGKPFSLLALLLFDMVLFIILTFNVYLVIISE
jgi:hypothetical protein